MDYFAEEFKKAGITGGDAAYSKVDDVSVT